jgi:histidinol-phosphatase (PHP family)
MDWGNVGTASNARRGRPSVAKRAGAPLPDYHVHSRWSDGAGEVTELVARAAHLGLPEIGVADHLVPYDPHDDYGIAHDRLDDYVAAVHEAAAANRDQVRVLLGIEVDYCPQWSQLVGLLAAHAFDYIIGSVHAVDGRCVDYIEEAVLRDWPDEDELFTRYYGKLAEMAGSGVIQVAGHLDLPKKFGRRPGAAAAAAEEAALNAIAAAGVLLELNTSGLRYPVAEPFPSEGLLRRARERGIGLVFGSDAHAPAEIASGFDGALALARAAGYTSYVRLSDREEVPLP